MQELVYSWVRRLSVVHVQLQYTQQGCFVRGTSQLYQMSCCTSNCEYRAHRKQRYDHKGMGLGQRMEKYTGACTLHVICLAIDVIYAGI